MNYIDRRVIFINELPWEDETVGNLLVRFGIRICDILEYCREPK